MMSTSFAQKRYTSAKKRFLLPSIQNFLQTHCPKMFGPLLARFLAENLLALVEKQLPAQQHLKAGQIVWNAVSARTRPDSPKVELVPVILTLVAPADIELFEKATPTKAIAQQAIARICYEAHQQGALLSMRDISLFCWRHATDISSWRASWEKLHNTTLPHCGSLQDFGSCVSHKKVIVRKAIAEKKDPKRVAAETKHSQFAVDRYLKDYHRVETCYKHNPNVDFIAHVTALSPYLVKQYLEIINASQT